MTTRQEKVNSLLLREISSYLRTEGFEGLSGLVTVTGVDVSADLEHAKIFFSSIGQDPRKVEEILRKHIYEIQGMLIKKLGMKKIPRIAFLPDYSGEYAQKILKIIREIRKDDDSGQSQGSV